MASAPRSGSVDATPFLESSPSSGFPSRLFARRPYLRNAARFVLRVSGNSQPVREPSARVREAAADHLEGRRSSWSYSKPVVLMDLAWNLAFVIAAATVVLISLEESPSAPLRLWILGYGLQCVLHMLCVVVEYRRRSNSAFSDWGDEGSNSGSSSGSERGYYGLGQTQGDAETTSVSKHLESVNTMFCFIWWILGFYWVSAAGQSLKDNAPQLYWLCIAFMLFDVLFAAICVVVACLLGFAICCFLPCIIAILYAVADQDGATKEQIDGLPKYKYRRMGNLENLSDEIEECLGGMENALSLEDAECSICLSAYEEGVELRRLPCHHHFHSPCVDKWLCINATCPLCKFDIRMNGDLCCAGREA